MSLTGTNLKGLKETILAPLEAEPIVREIREA